MQASDRERLQQGPKTFGVGSVHLGSCICVATLWRDVLVKDKKLSELFSCSNSPPQNFNSPSVSLACVPLVSRFRIREAVVFAATLCCDVCPKRHSSSNGVRRGRHFTVNLRTETGGDTKSVQWLRPVHRFHCSEVCVVAATLCASVADASTFTWQLLGCLGIRAPKLLAIIETRATCTGLAARGFFIAGVIDVQIAQANITLPESNSRACELRDALSYCGIGRDGCSSRELVGDGEGGRGTCLCECCSSLRAVPLVCLAFALDVGSFAHFHCRVFRVRTLGHGGYVVVSTFSRSWLVLMSSNCW